MTLTMRFLAGFAMAFLIAVGLTISGCNAQMRTWKLEKQGVVVEADLVKGFITNESRSAKSYGFDVRFVPKGGKRTTTFIKVPKQFYAEHQDPQDNKVMVRYLASNPEVAMIDGVRSGWETKFWLSPILALLSGLCVVHYFRKLQS